MSECGDLSPAGLLCVMSRSFGTRADIRRVETLRPVDDRADVHSAPITR